MTQKSTVASLQLNGDWSGDCNVVSSFHGIFIPAIFKLQLFCRQILVCIQQTKYKCNEFNLKKSCSATNLINTFQGNF